MAQVFTYGGQQYEVPDGVNYNEAVKLVNSGQAKSLDSSSDEGGVISTTSDIAQGVGAGLVGAVQGIAETGAMAADIIFDTDTSRSVSQGFDSAKEYLGLTPETAAGQTAETLTTFGAALIPVVGWVGRASSVARGVSGASKAKGVFGKSAEAFGKSKTGKALLASDNNIVARTKLAATTSLAGGAAEMLVAPDGTHTLADSFDILPDALETESDSGLQGRDEAYRRLRNKLRMGVEGTATGAAFEALFPVLGTATRVVSMTPGVSPLARGISQGYAYLGDKVGNSFNGAPKKYFTSAGGNEKEIYEGIRTIQDLSENQAEKAARLISDFDKNARKVAGGQKLFGRGKEGVQQAYDDLLTFLEGDLKALDKYNNKSLVGAATKMRDQIDELSDLALQELKLGVEAGTVNQKKAMAAIKEIEHNKGSYLRRIYEGAFSPDTATMKKLAKTPGYKKAVNEIAKIIQKNDSNITRADAVAKAEQEIQGTITKGMLDEGLSPEATATALSKSFDQQAQIMGRVPLYQLSENMFMKRSKFIERSPALRELMNEVKDPKELFMRTISDLSTFAGAERFYRTLGQRRLSYEEALPQLDQFLKNGFRGPRPLVISGENIKPGTPIESTLQAAGYVRLGERKTIEGKGAKTVFAGKYGDLSGEYIQKELYNAITTPVRNDNIATELLSIALQAKGLSQMAKTVLNPVGQVRNFASGTFMVGANGNLPRNAQLGEAFDAVFKKINGLSDSDKDKFFTMVSDLGLVDGNLAVNEMKLLLQETAGAGSQKTANALNALTNKVPGVKALQQIYSDTDTFWKVVGFTGEKAKFGAAFRKAGLDPENLTPAITQQLRASGLAPRTSELTGRYNFLDVFASDIVKETMPIYSRVPEVIKSIRRIPVAGNFVAFPAEILRNTSNILQRGMKELAFKSSDEMVAAIKSSRNLTDEQAVAAARQLEREIRAIGANRLTSYVASAAVIPTAIQRASLMANDMSEEDLEAVKPFLPFYMEGQKLMALNKPGKDGKFEYANLSYMMPYDFMLAPARRALEVYERKGELGASEIEQITSASWGAFSSFMEPFAGESLIAERLQDALPREYFGRGGETRTGSPVWSDSNDTGTKIQKSLLHIAGGMMPTGAELGVRVTARGLEPGRLTAAYNQVPTASGQQYDVHEEFLSLATGMRKAVLDVPESLSYKGFGFTDLRAQAMGDFTRTAKANNTTREDIVNAYRSANQDLFRAQRDMYGFIQSAKKAGLSDAQIYRSLRSRANIGKEEFSFLVQGKFRPISITSRLFKQVYEETAVDGKPRVTSQLPGGDLNRIYGRLVGQSLADESLDFQPRQAPQPAPQPTQQSAAALPSSTVPAQAGAVSAPQSAPAPSSQPQDAAGILPLLGSGLDALKNLQIFQRTQ
ncbi:MAG: hypothetical protein NWE77_01270 [Candidatus Bathyarchaeota archaeon]|nr:hypothetical protein [Candidatus Bathyarchaeota archaeon]